MAHRTSTDGPYFSSGSISWSQLKSTFRSSASGSNIKASDFIRYTNVNLTDPEVPDCTENGAVASSQSNWKASQFRNTIRFYYVTQYEEQSSSSPAYADINTLTRDGSGTTTDGSNGGKRWNSNLPKNIKKYYTLTGICGSNNYAWPALQALGTVYNLEVEIRGSILGASGPGGVGQSLSPQVYPAGAGTNGGNALSMQTNGARIPIRVKSGSRIYAGGGGGPGGNAGLPGTAGRCYADTTTQGCGSAPGCPSPYSNAGTRDKGCCSSVSYCCGFFCCGCVRCTRNTTVRYCVYDQPSTIGQGGNGGSGAPGRGYNNQSGSLTGSAGSPGTCPTCSFGGLRGGTCGTQGSNGGYGGDWGGDGRSYTSVQVLPAAGKSGRAVTGSNYFLTSDSSSSSLRGAA